MSTAVARVRGVPVSTISILHRYIEEWWMLMDVLRREGLELPCAITRIHKVLYTLSHSPSFFISSTTAPEEMSMRKPSVAEHRPTPRRVFKNISPDRPHHPTCLSVCRSVASSRPRARDGRIYIPINAIIHRHPTNQPTQYMCTKKKLWLMQSFVCGEM